jgi:hypothetical protein
MHKPKLGVIVFDCYSRAATPQDNINFKAIRNYNVYAFGRQPGLKNIFRSNKGIVMVRSGSDVEKPLCSTQVQPIGGLFTSNFLDGLFAYDAHPNADWNNVRVYTRCVSEFARMKPEPVFQFNIHNPNGRHIRGGGFSPVGRMAK